MPGHDSCDSCVSADDFLNSCIVSAERSIADSAECMISVDSATNQDGRRQECAASTASAVTDTNMILDLVMLSTSRIQRFNNQYGIARVEKLLSVGSGPCGNVPVLR